MSERSSVLLYTLLVVCGQGGQGARTGVCNARGALEALRARVGRRRSPDACRAQHAPLPTGPPSPAAHVPCRAAPITSFVELLGPLSLPKTAASLRIVPGRTCLQYHQSCGQHVEVVVAAELACSGAGQGEEATGLSSCPTAQIWALELHAASVRCACDHPTTRLGRMRRTCASGAARGGAGRTRSACRCAPWRQT